MSASKCASRVAREVVVGGIEARGTRLDAARARRRWRGHAVSRKCVAEAQQRRHCGGVRRCGRDVFIVNICSVGGGRAAVKAVV